MKGSPDPGLKATNPDRGIETGTLSLISTAWSRLKATNPDRGIETNDGALSGAESGSLKATNPDRGIETDDTMQTDTLVFELEGHQCR